MSDYNVSELKIDEFIWVIFIILSILNIYGDKCLEDYYKYNIDYKNREAKDIFTVSVFITLIIYLYLLYKRYKVYEDNKLNNRDTKICGMRLFGTLLIVSATILFLYCQLEDRKAINPTIV